MAFTKKASILFEAGEPCQEHACPQGDSSNFDDEVKMTSRRCWDNSAKFCWANVDDRERAMTWVAIVSKSFGFVKKMFGALVCQGFCGRQNPKILKPDPGFNF